LGYWELPRPHKGAEKQWHVIARVTRTIPFGYEVDPNNDKLLQPIIPELEALELAKNHILQYTYKEVALWLTKQTGRYISGKGLKKRVDIERKRKKAATIKRKLAKRLQETLQEIKNLEEERIGAYTVKSRAATA
tara:strand:- start:7231 stop:7635 length:405 start_codon:yes stop_codon:yes gene_type:complete